MKKGPEWTGAYLLVAALLLGCGDSGGGATVQGKVTYNGQPVTSGLINFVAGGGRPIGGPLKPDGSYELRLPPGQYQVRVDAPAPIPPNWKEGDPLPTDKDRPVPVKYASFDSSGLTATVGDSGDSIDFALP